VIPPLASPDPEKVVHEDGIEPPTDRV